MENTGGVFFEGEQGARWYVAQGDRWLGPLTAAEVHEKIQSQELSWAHYVWTEGQADWQRLCDVPMFQAAVPGKPQTSIAARLKAEAEAAARAPEVRKAQLGRAPAPPSGSDLRAELPEGNLEDDREWFLYYNDTQFGPFSADEISRFLRIGKIHGRVYGWRDGMGNWEKLEKLVAFGEAVEESRRARAQAAPQRPGAPAGPQLPVAPAPEITGFVERRAAPRGRPSELRAAPRMPLVARILMAGDEEAKVVVAMCRDVSVGGMQVLTDHLPGGIGARIRLNVSPASDSSEPRIRPFVAQGVIVRILEDGRGFSFRFDRLRGDARRSIEDYVGVEQKHLDEIEAGAERLAEAGVTDV